MNGNKTALVLGATGLVGKELVQQLLDDRRYSTVTCLVRRPLPSSWFDDTAEKLHPIVIDFDRLDEYQGYFCVDHVFCCLGTTLKKAGSRAAFRKVDFEYIHVAAQLTRAQRAASFVWISSVDANATSRHFYLRVKGELENALMRMPQLSHVSAVRPSLLLGKRTEKRPLEEIGRTLAPLLGAILRGPLAKYRPVAASQVAAKMISLQPFDDVQ